MSVQTDTRYLELEALRGANPVMWDPGASCFYLTRYSDVRSVLCDTEHWRDPDRAVGETFLKWIGRDIAERPDERGSHMGWMDDPHHARVRWAIGEHFYPRTSAAEPYIEKVVDDCLGGLSPGDRFDVISGLGRPVPTATIAHIIGFELEDVPKLQAWTDTAFKIFQLDRSEGDDAEMDRAMTELAEFLEAEIAKRKVKLSDDLLSDLVRLQTEGAHLTHGEIRVGISELLTGGHVSVTDAIGSALYLLLTHPDQMEKVRADPSLIGAAVEEALRLEAPIDSQWRIASRGGAFGGCPHQQGQVLVGSIAAANRDPDKFTDPHRFDVTRPLNSHLSFGGGPHICIGHPLAPLEARICLRALLERFPNLRLAEPDAAPKWRATNYFRGLSELLVEV